MCRYDGCVGRYSGGCIGAMGRRDGRIDRCNGCVGRYNCECMGAICRCNGHTEMWDGSGC